LNTLGDHLQKTTVDLDLQWNQVAALIGTGQRTLPFRDKDAPRRI
jgi:hypothetical protein